MSDIASRALAAHEAEVETRRLTAEATKLRMRGLALEMMTAAAENFGLTFDPDEIVENQATGKWMEFGVRIYLNEDADLRINCRPADDAYLALSVKPSDELYYDQSPGPEPRRKGTYGCFGLTSLGNRPIHTLADIGWALNEIRRARHEWNRKHLRKEGEDR